MQLASRNTLYLLLTSVTLAMCGCGSPMPATVSGTVTLDGEPIKASSTVQGTIMFYPVGGGAAAYGTLDKNGHYAISTGSSKGLEPGEYVATVRIVEMPEEPPGGFANAPPQKLISPARYEDRKQSGLQATVENGRNEIDLALVTTE